MKNILILVLFLTSSVVLAGSTGGTQNQNQNQKQTNSSTNDNTSQSGASTQNAIDYSQTSGDVKGSDLSRGIGTGIAPNLTSGFNTCLGSASVGAGWSGLGFGAGKTYEDDPCNRRNNAMTMAKMGSVATAREVMCGDIDVLRASVRAGKPCWLQDENLLDELSDAERKYYNTLVALPIVVPLNTAAAELQKRMDNVEANTNTKLDALHRLNQQK